MHNTILDLFEILDSCKDLEYLDELDLYDVSGKLIESYSFDEIMYYGD